MNGRKINGLKVKRNWLLQGLVFLSFVFLQIMIGEQTFAADFRGELFSSVSSEFMQVQDPFRDSKPEKNQDSQQDPQQDIQDNDDQPKFKSKYPWYAEWLHSDLLKWDPTGVWSANISSQCDPYRWQQNLLSSSVPNVSALSVIDYFNKCESQLKTGHNSSGENIIEPMTLQLHPQSYPFARHVIFHLPKNVELRGLLALKPDFKKRPLVIFRAGIFANTQEFYPERSLFMQMFEQSPFNLLLLESLSGVEFAQHNSSVSLGGFDEGLQNFLIAQQLQKSSEPLSKYISNVHLLAISMGGHGLMFATLLNQWNGGKTISSAMAFCPLLQFQETFDYHRSQGVSIEVMNLWATKRVREFGDKLSSVREDSFIQDILTALERQRTEPLIGWPKSIRIAPEMSSYLQKASKVSAGDSFFWRANRFWQWYNQVQTPVLIFATYQDPVVPWFVNTGRVVDGRLNLSSSNVHVYNFNEGYHCSLTAPYDWSSTAMVYQTYYLKNSPNFHRQLHSLHFSKEQLSGYKIAREYFKEGAASLPLHFDVEKGSSVIRVFLDLQNSTSVWTRSLFKIEKGLRKYLGWSLRNRLLAEIPIDQTEFDFHGQPPQSSDEISILTRWCNQNIRPVLDTTKEELDLQWWTTL